jgi:transcriptional regulator with XRE-family HTH domain
MTNHNLRKTVKDKGIKITYLANKIGVSQPLLSMYLSGRRKMPMDIEFKLAKELA